MNTTLVRGIASDATWIKHPLACWTGNSHDAGNGIVIRGSRIVELVARGQEPKTPYQHTFDASGHVVLPGLINCHHHFYQTLTRALTDSLKKKLFTWLQQHYP